MSDLERMTIIWKRNLSHLIWLTQHWAFYDFAKETEGIKENVTQYTRKMETFYNRAVGCYHEFCDNIFYNPLNLRYGLKKAVESGIRVNDIRGALILVGDERYPLGFLEEQNVELRVMEEQFQAWKAEVLKSYDTVILKSAEWWEKEKESIDALENHKNASIVRGVSGLLFYTAGAYKMVELCQKIKGIEQKTAATFFAIAFMGVLSILILREIGRCIHEIYLYHKECMLKKLKRRNENLIKCVSERMKELIPMSYQQFRNKVSMFSNDHYRETVKREMAFASPVIHLYEGRTAIVTTRKEILSGLALLIIAEIVCAAVS